MEGITDILFRLFIIFTSAKIMGEIFERLRQPALIGEILAGVILGPHLLNMIPQEVVYEVLAEIGVMVLLFTVGLHIKVEDILKVGGRSTLVAVLGVVFPFVLGYIYTLISGHNTIEAMFIGAAMVATSVGITARIFADLNLMDSEIARVILGAAVIDDILGMIILAVVTGAGQGTLSYLNLGIIAAEAVGFVLFLVFIGTRLARRYVPRVANLRARNAVFILALIALLGLSAVASSIKLAAIIGAFMAGLVLAEFNYQFQLTTKTESLYDFLVPFFFVMLGSRVDLSVFANPAIWGAAGLITFLAIIGKLIGCGLVMIKSGFKTALQVGVGMTPRGEVGMIVASIGLASGAINPELYAVVLFMVVATTVLAPPILRKLLV
ncbi:MAG: cation:proton antiporter [candidate division Zixibacteria bacterium]|nr:cation:proton antiporter [candidate division Zixibacteria bacterium]